MDTRPQDAARADRCLYRFVLRDVIIAHRVSAFAAFVWAALLLLPGHIFATNPLFTHMARREPERVFGLAYLGTLLMDLAALYLCRASLSLAALLTSALVWGVTAVLTAFGSPPLPVWPHWLPFAPGPWVYGGLFVWLLGASVARVGPALGDDVTLWRARQALRRARREINRALRAARASDKAMEASGAAETGKKAGKEAGAGKSTARTE